MIKVTYTIVCDICKTECDTDHFNLSTSLFANNLPKANHRYTYAFRQPMELCDDCALPLFKARDAVVAQYIQKIRGQE